jgi:hypothetical protein
VCGLRRVAGEDLLLDGTKCRGWFLLLYGQDLLFRAGQLLCE